MSRREQHDQTPGTDYRESPVKRSRSFADLSRHDVNFIRQGELSRVISYPTPSEEQLRLRQSLSDRQLVLGEESENKDAGLERFVIPGSARPISRDRRMRKGGPYNYYQDPQLFFHLGLLLGRVAEEGPEEPLVLGDTVGLNVAIAIGIDYRRRLGEPAMLLVPGFERKVEAVEDDDEVLRFYADKLLDEFGPRFEDSTERFESGLRTTLAL